MGTVKQFIHRGIQWGPAGLLAGCLVLLLSAPAPAEGERAPLPDELQGDVNRAIDRGVAYLAATQMPDGSWQAPDKKEHVVGYAALPALTLLECGVSPKEPIIQRAANFVRLNCLTLDRTYEIALSILLLDRIGDPADDARIRVLALRLIVSQTATGGWGYKCLVLPTRDNIDLFTALKRLTPNRPPPMEAITKKPEPKPDLDKPTQRKPEDLGPGVSRGSGNGSLDPVTRDNRKPLEGTPTRPGSPGESKSPGSSGSVAPFPSDRPGGSSKVGPGLDDKARPKPDAQGGGNKTDKTDPGEKAKPAAPAPPEPPYIMPRKLQIVPVLQDHQAQALVDPDKRDQEPLLSTTDNSNTQFAMLGVWAAQRHGVPIDLSLRLIARRFETSQNTDGAWGYRYKNGGGEGGSGAMTAVGLIGLAIAQGMAEPGAKAGVDPRITKGLLALSNHIGTPTGKTKDLPGLPSLYLLWSIERVGVLYQVPRINNKDWYHWGAELLVGHQQADGFWDNKGAYPGSAVPLDTCLALLFLKRANLTRNMSQNLPKPKEVSAAINKTIPPEPPPTPPPDPTPVAKTVEADIPPAPQAPQQIDKSLDFASEVGPAAAAEPPPPPERGSRLWLILLLAGVALALALGGGGLFLLLHHNAQKKEEEDDYEEEEERPHRRRPPPPKSSAKRRRS